MNSDPDAPLDTQLLQLERELFSLSPVETPRHLASRLDRQVMAPVCVGRRIASSAKVIPFQWRRIMVPAAAAVVVVSVLHHLDAPSKSGSGVAQANPAFPVRSPGHLPVTVTTGYVLRAEPVLISPGMQQHYFIQPPAGSGPGYHIPPRTAGFSPVVFH